MSQKISLGLYQPNPSLSNGAIQFNKSQTGTMYQRFNATYMGADGQPRQILAFLNADLVASQAVIPQSLEGLDIFMPDVDFQVALERQQPEVLAAGQARIAITQFNVDMDDELKQTLTNAAIQERIASNARLSADVKDKKAAYRKQLLAGTATSSLDARLQNRAGVGTFQPAANAVDPNTNEGNRFKDAPGANEATSGELGGGKGVSTADGGGVDPATLNSNAAVNQNAAGEEVPV